MIGHPNTLIHGGPVLPGHKIDGHGMATGVSGKRLRLGTRTGRSLKGEITTTTGRRDRQLQVHGTPGSTRIRRGERFGMYHLGRDIENVIQYVTAALVEIMQVIGAVNKQKTAIKKKKIYLSCPLLPPPRSELRTHRGGQWGKFQRVCLRLPEVQALLSLVFRLAPSSLHRIRQSSMHGRGNRGWTIGAQLKEGAYQWKLEAPV